VLRDELVQRIDQAAGVDGAQNAGSRLGEAYLREERNAPACVAGQKRAVAADKPPALAASRGRNVSEEPSAFGIRQRKQREIFSPVESGDDTRRELAEPSGAGVEQRSAQER
jgi:hypothetical protein